MIPSIIFLLKFMKSSQVVFEIIVFSCLMMRELFGDGATVANNKLEKLMVIVLK